MTTADRLLDRVDELKVCSGTAARLQRMKDGAVSLDRVGRVVETDPVLASRILAVANSGMYGPARSTSTVRDALNRLGLTRTVNLAWGLAASAIASEQPKGADLRKHGMRVANGARLIARNLKEVDQGTAFLGGLLHDIGKQLFLVLEPERYAALLDRHPFDDVRRHIAELTTFGADHAELGKRCLHAWDLPEPLTTAIGNHHRIRILNRGRPDSTLAFAGCLGMAEVLDDFRERGLPVDVCLDELVGHPLNQLLRISEPRWRIVLDVFDEELEIIEQLLS